MLVVVFPEDSSPEIGGLRVSLLWDTEDYGSTWVDEVCHLC
jgi:hypothetical protein